MQEDMLAGNPIDASDEDSSEGKDPTSDVVGLSDAEIKVTFISPAQNLITCSRAYLNLRLSTLQAITASRRRVKYVQLAIKKKVASLYAEEKVQKSHEQAEKRSELSSMKAADDKVQVEAKKETQRLEVVHDEVAKIKKELQEKASWLADVKLESDTAWHRERTLHKEYWRERDYAKLHGKKYCYPKQKMAASEKAEGVESTLQSALRMGTTGDVMKAAPEPSPEVYQQALVREAVMPRPPADVDDLPTDPLAAPTSSARKLLQSALNEAQKQALAADESKNKKTVYLTSAGELQAKNDEKIKWNNDLLKLQTEADSVSSAEDAPKKEAAGKEDLLKTELKEKEMANKKEATYKSTHVALSKHKDFMEMQEKRYTDALKGYTLKADIMSAQQKKEVAWQAKRVRIRSHIAKHNEMEVQAPANVAKYVNSDPGNTGELGEISAEIKRDDEMDAETKEKGQKHAIHLKVRAQREIDAWQIREAHACIQRETSMKAESKAVLTKISEKYRQLKIKSDNQEHKMKQVLIDNHKQIDEEKSTKGDEKRTKEDVNEKTMKTGEQDVAKMKENLQDVQDKQKRMLYQAKKECHYKEQDVAQEALQNITDHQNAIKVLRNQVRESKQDHDVLSHRCTTVQTSYAKLAERISKMTSEREMDTAQKDLKNMGSKVDDCEANQGRSEAQWFELEQRMKKTQHAILVQRATAVEYGCGCKNCDKGSCPLCAPGFNRESKPHLDPQSLQCRCQCSCELTPLPSLSIPEGMTLWKDLSAKPELGESETPEECKKNVDYKIYRCTGGRQVRGCFDGKMVEFGCGCNSLHFETFSIKQKLNTPGSCPLPSIEPEELRGFSSWHRVCKLGEAVTVTCPFVPPKSNNMTDPMDKPGALKRVAPFIRTSQASLNSMSTKLVADQELMNHKMNFKWVPATPIRWTKKHLILPSVKSFKKIQCTALFMQGAVICNKGRTVMVPCTMGGKRQDLTIGCGCGGPLAQGVVKAMQNQLLGMFCSKYMEEWTNEIKPAFFLGMTTAAECAATAQLRCDDTKQAYKDNQKRVMEQLREKMAEKMTDFGQTMRIVSLATKHEQKVMQTMKDTWKPPKYHKIPGFGIHGDPSKTDAATCEHECSSIGSCKAYSFNSLTNECISATKTLTYDDNYVLYIMQTADDAGAQPFIAVPGMRIGGASDPVKEEKLSLNECQYDCMNSNGRCKAVTFRVPNGCELLDIDIIMGSNWNYYEKAIDKGMLEYEKNMMELRQRQETLQIQHLRGKVEKNAVKLNGEMKAALATTVQPLEESA